MSDKYKVKIRQLRNPNYDHAVLPISIGQEYHEGDKFLAALKAAKQKFGNVTVFICDTSKRHNLVLDGLSQSESLTEARLRGDEWLARHKDMIETEGANIVRWDEWRLKPEFEALKNAVQEVINDNSELKQAVLVDANRFLSKKSYPLDKAIKACEDYLAEELAIDSMVARDMGGTFLYPGSSSAAFEFLRTEGSESVPDWLKTMGYGKIKFNS